MHRRWIIKAVTTAGITAVLVFIFLNSLRMPEAYIEASLLRLAPLGSNTTDVRLALEKKGFHPQLVGTGFYKQKNPARPEVVGVSSIRIELGEYRTFFVTSVSAFWGFDANGKLIDVWVWKTVDAL